MNEHPHTELRLSLGSYVLGSLDPADRAAVDARPGAPPVAKSSVAVGVLKLWSTSYPSGSGPATTSLSLVVRRRNRIVHQCDADPLSPGNVTPLSAADASDSLAIVEGVISAIDPHC